METTQCSVMETDKDKDNGKDTFRNNLGKVEKEKEQQEKQPLDCYMGC